MLRISKLEMQNLFIPYHYLLSYGASGTYGYGSVFPDEWYTPNQSCLKNQVEAGIGFPGGWYTPY